MKRKLYICFCILQYCIFLCYSFDKVPNMQQLIDTQNVSFSLMDLNNNNNFFAAIMIENGKISCGYGGHIEACILDVYSVFSDRMEISFEKIIFRNFSEGENMKYRRWIYPTKYKIEITIDDFLNALKQKWHDLEIPFDTYKTYPTTCQGIVIDNLNVREEPSLTGKKIGKLKKRDEITLYEQSNSIDEIDGEKNPWYKVKVTENEYGWVYGGYVRIFFEDENLGYSDKEKILESLN